MAGVGCCSCLLGGEADAYDGDAGVVVDTVLPMGGAEAVQEAADEEAGNAEHDADAADADGDVGCLD